MPTRYVALRGCESLRAYFRFLSWFRIGKTAARRGSRHLSETMMAEETAINRACIEEAICVENRFGPLVTQGG